MLQIAFFTIWFIVTCNFIINLVYLRPRKNTVSDKQISVVIPCRDEENHIELCLKSCLQNGNNFSEIIVVDDGSSDGSVEKIRTMMQRSKLIKLISAKRPDGWSGKSYACFVGAQSAKSNLILFLDADVRLKTNVHIPISKFDLTFFIPEFINSNLSEKIFIPFRINFLLLFLLPMSLMNVNIQGKAVFANALGQILLVKKDKYFLAGGHEKIKSSIVDDIALAQLFVSEGMKIEGRRGQHLAQVKMYDSFADCWRGCMKNYYANFGGSILNLTLLWIFIFIFILTPFVFVIISPIFSLLLLISNVCMWICLMSFTYWKFSFVDFILSIVGIFFNFACSAESFRRGIFKIGYVWKERIIMTEVTPRK